MARPRPLAGTGATAMAAAVAAASRPAQASEEVGRRLGQVSHRREIWAGTAGTEADPDFVRTRRGGVEPEAGARRVVRGELARRGDGCARRHVNRPAQGFG